MKSILLFFFFFGITFISFSQEDVIDVVEQPAEFPGGQPGLMRFLAENIVYPDEALELGIQGKCYARFVVTKKGNVSNVEIIKGVEYCPECDAEVIRVLKMMPKWKPARNNGKKVNSYYNIPISFIATSSGKREEK